ncbi:uncharacterized protein [Watersipora subatra]|uniref:uncharacterized protein isoform X1 n=1 Tax=Watersipora subatra TaxID=2589382 RepID=UPI00355BD112
MWRRLFTTASHSRSSMRVVGLISGGKDSCFNLLKCVAEDHEVVALANLHPADSSIGELNSYMYQTVGHEMIGAVAEALELPLYRRALKGTSLSVGKSYDGPEAGDEVEDLYELLKEVKEAHNIQGVSVGAVLSDYQRVRVENVCCRLGLTSLGYLWSCNQTELLTEMLACQVEAVLVKVACIGLKPKEHLNRPLSSLVRHLTTLNKDYGVHMCGEGGEYESLTLDCPLYNSKIIIEESEIVEDTPSDIAPVGHLRVNKYRLEPKADEVRSVSWLDRVRQLPLKTSCTFTEDFLSSVPATAAVSFSKTEYSNLVTCWPEKHLSVVKSSETEVFCSLQAANTGDVEVSTKSMMDELKGILESHKLDFSSASYVLLYISDMSLFSRINAVYKDYFGINPPPRICVEAVLPETSLFHAMILCSRKPKDTRHVQGVSHWAPSCIGPYSQVAKVGSNVYVSGQIPLVPGSMKPLVTGFPGQSQLALDHALSVATSMSVSEEHVATAHCYICREEDAPYIFSESVVDVRLSKRVQPLCIITPRLPRDVLVEWHLNFDLHSLQPHNVHASDDNLDAVCSKLEASLKANLLYFMFYSAPTIDINLLLQGLPEHIDVIPIPVVKVVPELERLSDRYQVACIQVLGYTSDAI